MPKRILVVEDEQDHRELLKLIFSMHGYDVDTAANGHEAFELLRRHPDLVVLDVMLPDMDGWVLAEQVKHEAANTEHPQIMMLSASAHMQMRFEESSADDMLTKPFDDEELISKVRHLLHE